MRRESHVRFCEGLCQERAPLFSIKGGRDAVPEMKDGPSESACRSRLQTAVSCCRTTAAVVNVTVKRRDLIASCVGQRDECKRTTDEASKQNSR